METPQTKANIPQEQNEEKKRSPWLIILLILLIVMMCCCVMGVVLCRGGAMLPDFLNRYLDDIPGFESGEIDFWGLVEDFPDFENFNPQDYFPEGDLPEDLEELIPGGSICQGLSGELEMQVLIGPAEVTGLEPLGIGTIPLQVQSSSGEYLVTGFGTIDYQDQLDEVWGFYVVTFDSTAVLEGTCVGDDESGVLNVVVLTEGEQLIQVFVGNDEWSYPWSGEYTFDLEFPIEDGAISSGEGWAFVLHLD